MARGVEAGPDGKTCEKIIVVFVHPPVKEAEYIASLKHVIHYLGLSYSHMPFSEHKLKDGIETQFGFVTLVGRLGCLERLGHAWVGNVKFGFKLAKN